MNQTFQRVDGLLQARLKNSQLLFGHRLQNILGRILAWGWTTNPYFQSHEVWSSERLDDGFDPVMSPGTTGKLDPESPGLQVEIVVHNDEFAGGETEFPQESLQRRAGNIHPIEQAGQLY